MDFLAGQEQNCHDSSWVTPLNSPLDSISSGVGTVQSILYGLSKDHLRFSLIICPGKCWLFSFSPFSPAQPLCSSLWRLCPEGTHILTPIAEVLNSREQVAGSSLPSPWWVPLHIAASTRFNVQHKNPALEVFPRDAVVD